MKQLAADRAVARIRKKLDGLPCVPNRELLALSGPAKELIFRLRGSDVQQNDMRFQLGAVLLEGQQAAKSNRHYLSWCDSLGLQPRTAQNYVRVASAFGECRGPFCDLKTTTIYRLAASSEEIKTKALEAAKSGSLTPAEASALLKRQTKPDAAPTEAMRRVAQIFDRLKPQTRAELISLLPTINLKMVLILLADPRHLPEVTPDKGTVAQVSAVSRSSQPESLPVAEASPPMDTYILKLGESLQLPA